MVFASAPGLTHAGDDAVHREPRRPVVERPGHAALLALVLVFKS